jgi:hypothetical protein
MSCFTTDSRIRRSVVPLLVLLGGFAVPGRAADEVDFERRQVTRITPGTIVGRENDNGWNRVVLFAQPRLGSGAVEKIPAIARGYATRFSVVIMARVRGVERQRPDAKYELERVGVGYCTRIGDQDVVISSDTHKQLGAGLDTIEKIVLGQNEKVLDEMVQIVRSRTVTMFDVQALVLHRDKPDDMLVRHLVWVVPATGRVAALVWPLNEDAQGNYHVTNNSLVLLAGGFREDRVIHVSSEEITLGIPSSRAFALARMPQGKQIPLDDQLARLAARKQYDRDTMQQLLDAIRTVF